MRACGMEFTNAVFKRPFFRTTACSLVLVICVAVLLSGCKRTADEEAASLIEQQRTRNLHLRLNFAQSPIDGVPTSQGNPFQGGVTNSTDIFVQLCWVPDHPNQYRGTFQVFRTLTHEAMVLFMSECHYNAKSGELRIGPSFGFLRCPDSVYANEGKVGDRTQPAGGWAQIREFSWTGYYLLEGIYEEQTLANMVENKEGGILYGPSPSVHMVPGPGSEEIRKWRFKVSIASLGFMGQNIDHNWRGLRLEEPKSGIGQMTIGHRFKRPVREPATTPGNLRTDSIQQTPAGDVQEAAPEE